MKLILTRGLSLGAEVSEVRFLTGRGAECRCHAEQFVILERVSHSFVNIWKEILMCGKSPAETTNCENGKLEGAKPTDEGENLTAGFFKKRKWSLKYCRTVQ